MFLLHCVMEISELSGKIHKELYEILSSSIRTLRPAQEKSISAGLLEGKNILVCTPTASGKTLVAEIAMLEAILGKKGKAVYIVPLKALASEKHREFTKKYPNIKVALSIGDIDSSDTYLDRYDLIITVSEKLDSLIRHKAPWIGQVRCVVVDEIHMLNDPTRGPTLEVVIMILRSLLKRAQFIALSATIGNPRELADWLEAELVEDSWRPIELRQGIYLEGKVEFEPSE